MNQIVGSTIGEYRIVDLLGVGGMGEVYRGVHSKIGRVAAIKVLTQATRTPSFLERFYNEARIQARLSHPNIAVLYDFLEFNGQACIIMEYVDGQTLSERISQSGLSFAEAVFVFQAVVEAVDYLHCHGVVHRDIKSNNIKIDQTGRVKLLDFGIAKSDATPNMTQKGDVVGTLECLSPEQLTGGTADMRSDVWALGILFYEMIGGRTPFAAPTIGQLYEKVTRGEYAALWSLRADTPRGIEGVIARCLQKNPAERYQSASELLQDVKRLTTPSQPPVGLQPSPVPTPGPMQTPSSQPYSRPPSGPVGAPARPNPGSVGRAPGSINSGPIIGIGAAAIVLVLVGVVAFVMWPGPSPSDDDNANMGLVAPANRNGGAYAGNQNPAYPNAANQNSANKYAGGRGQDETRAITINTVEGEAEVFEGDKLLGKTPYRFEDKLGAHKEFVLKRKGYKDKVIPVDVTNTTPQYNVRLDRKD